MNTFYMVAALTLYAITAWFFIQAFITGVKAATAKPGFNKRAFITGFALLTICAAIWAFNSSGAMASCERKHSAITCRAAIR